MKVVATQRGTKGAAEEQFLVHRRELSQVSLHHVDEHRGRATTRTPAADFGGASDPPTVSELDELSRDPDHPCIQVQVATSDSYELTPPETGKCRQQHQRPEPWGNELGD